MERQSKQESEAVDMLSLQQEELKSLHDESKALAEELGREREQILQDELTNRKKLQELDKYDDKMEVIKATIVARNKQIEDLEKQLGESENKVLDRKKHINKAESNKVPKKQYKAARGDSVDEMLANVVNIKNVEIPISRLGDGHYMFGSKKIFTRIMNNKLVVRVGGGFMSMDEFIATYAESERLKLEHMNPADVEALHAGGKDKKMIKTEPLSNRAGSPRGLAGARSPKGGSPLGRGGSGMLGSPKGGQQKMAVVVRK